VSPTGFKAHRSGGDAIMATQKQLPIAVQILILIAVLGAIGIALYIFSLANVPPNSRRVTFRVESTGGSAKINWTAAKNHTDGTTPLTTPWERTVVLEHGTQVILTASPAVSGTVTCSISLEGQTWKKMKAEKENTGVACAGIIP
jgi:hypothetical protein